MGFQIGLTAGVQDDKAAAYQWVRGVVAACWLVGGLLGGGGGDPRKNPMGASKGAWKSAGYSPCCICHESPFSTWDNATQSSQRIHSLSAPPL